MAAVHPGKRNPNWRGGRSIASHGYVLIRVGMGHPLADVRGYAYEHRLIAFAKLGRLLAPGEIAHHVDGNKQNNGWDNIEVVKGNAEHFFEHRAPGSKLRKPGEPNTLIACACDCGEVFLRYDDAGRPRRYVSGHNQQPTPTLNAVLEALAKLGGAAVRADIARVAERRPPLVSTALLKLSRKGKVARDGHGRWRLCG